ncbi:hypothetical protein A3A93_04135 [Candidatus Roizmanbacteria bacterium RIFCSPLOWO2_01_FULL_38_12]|uniref:IrrE N-terminal-like domain-containing protein n=1 Tax=Candidatus Roizmanbacteria bacterium RIFCSPLOWO2_01_FULL_38_12 TaxID=1802061 RepID=A0A1F7IUZ7_9BACT|nr:MAG: hypothetical protein A2861_04385 [Candidatus Roizmanbacteria bacterium RIFCSPHIGHO2_01_FULL_38_15]OGK35038.1 MAG: hypothetical protein A3F59_00305 [Candidatus Roizmanbacteria bacterium RIFCSPHIGHO2_12_FULL_38_13]OGK47193.1 MAG: hypothetical protein A3A93_04135 [Candidatus Roizmanbacteria bacterium RIFCSPLOWO2_01_FULL_38_12]
MSYLSIDDQKRIESVVDNIKMQTGLSYPENDLIEIAKSLGIEVFESDVSEYPNIDGLLEYVDEKGKAEPKIFLNKDRPETRKRFTLAHEIGHYVLHKNDKVRYRIDELDYSDNAEDTKLETEANYFAAVLLVPEDKLRKILALSDNDYNVAAEFFGVSRPVIENRIKWIKTNKQ